MRSRLRFCVAVLALCIGPGRLMSQAQEAGVKPGDRIRVYRVADPEARVTGTFVARDASDLQLLSDNAKAPISIPLAEVSKLERSTGKHGHTLVGLGIGAGAGLGLGLAGAASTEPNDIVGIDAGGVALITGVLGAAGALIGTIVRSESWVEVPLASLELPPAPPADSTAPIVAPIAAGH